VTPRRSLLDDAVKVVEGCRHLDNEVEDVVQGKESFAERYRHRQAAVHAHFWVDGGGVTRSDTSSVRPGGIAQGMLFDGGSA